jgi:hypothetical protein
LYKIDTKAAWIRIPFGHKIVISFCFSINSWILKRQLYIWSVTLTWSFNDFILTCQQCTRRHSLPIWLIYTNIQYKILISKSFIIHTSFSSVVCLQDLHVYQRRIQTFPFKKKGGGNFFCFFLFVVFFK